MRRSVIVALLAGGAALACVPLLRLPAFYESILYLVLHWVLLATSWNILSGYSGYFSFGHGAFFGAGVYTTAVLAGKFDWPFLATLPAAAAVATVLGVALGAVVFRVRSVRGELFALLTLAVTFVLATIVLNTPIDGGPGIYLSAVPVPHLAPTQPGTFYLLALAGAVAALLIAYTVQQSRLGVGLFAIHDDEDAAEVMGVPTYRYKLAALAISCALAGFAGGVHALFIAYVTTGEVFSITVPLTVILMSVLGGTRHWAGPAVGATAITALLYAFTKGDLALAGKATTGAVLIAAILFMPQGIVPRLLQWRSASRTRTLASPARAPSAGASSPPRPHRAPPPARRPAPAQRELLLRTSALTKSFFGVQALAGIDVEIRRGEILGLIGPNGSGKSTFINVVSGHYTASAGRIQFEGREIAHLAAHRIAHAGIARTYQIPRPFAHLSVRDNVAAAAMFGGAALSSSKARDEARPLARVCRPQRQGRCAARRAEPAPAQVPRTGARAGVAAAPGAARRGVVRPQPGGDRRCGGADPAHPRCRHHGGLRRARDARRAGIERPPGGAEPWPVVGRRAGRAGDATPRRGGRLSGNGACCGSLTSRWPTARRPRCGACRCTCSAASC